MRTVRIVRRRVADPVFLPDQHKRSLVKVMADITRRTGGGNHVRLN